MQRTRPTHPRGSAGNLLVAEVRKKGGEVGAARQASCDCYSDILARMKALQEDTTWSASNGGRRLQEIHDKVQELTDQANALQEDADKVKRDHGSQRRQESKVRMEASRKRDKDLKDYLAHECPQGLMKALYDRSALSAGSEARGITQVHRHTREEDLDPSRPTLVLGGAEACPVGQCLSKLPDSITQARLRFTADRSTDHIHKGED